MSINLDYISDIACIDCGGDIEYIQKSDCLRCKNCQREYQIINGIPMMGGIDDRQPEPNTDK